MHMGTYPEILRRIQPAMKPLFSALGSGIELANRLHGTEGFDRSDDAHYWAHTVRRRTCEMLKTDGLQADLETEFTNLSAILVQYNGVWLRVLRPEIRKGSKELVPLPGRSKPRQAFYRQDPVLDDLEGVASDNILAIWRDKDGKLREPLKLVRPLGGDHERRNLRLDWEGELRSDMASLRAADLDALQPTATYPQLGSDTA